VLCRVAAAFNVSEQARLAKLPSFSLTASVGGSSDLSAAIGAYGAAVLNAFEGVEAALTNEQLLERRESYLARAVDNNLRAYELAMVQYNVGQTDLLSVLQMQSRWVGARLGLLVVKNQRLATRINLHLALGGSFDPQ
jgi:multidrug efflux system outer membrane protein